MKLRQQVLVWLIAIAVVAAALVVTWWVCRPTPWPTSPATAAGSSTGPTIEQVRRLAALTTLRVEVSDARVTELRGHTGGARAVLLVRGEILLGVDLSAARFRAVDPATKRVVLELPAPAVQVVRLDHQRTRLIGIWNDGLWAVAPGGGDADAATANAAYQEAEQAVAAVATEPAHIVSARAHAESVLRAFVEITGWTVEIRWSASN